MYGVLSLGPMLHRICWPIRRCGANVQRSADQDYVARQRQAGFSSRDILRRLKRAIGREVFRLLITPVAVPRGGELRPLRQATNITLTAAANQLGVWPTTISELEATSLIHRPT